MGLFFFFFFRFVSNQPFLVLFFFSHRIRASKRAPQGALLKIRGRPCQVSRHTLGVNTFHQLNTIARRSNNVSRPKSGTLLDWSMSFVDVSTNRSVVTMAPAPEERAVTLTGIVAPEDGTGTIHLSHADHLPHAVELDLFGKPDAGPLPALFEKAKAARGRAGSSDVENREPVTKGA